MILIVQSVWNASVTDNLVKGAEKVLRRENLPYKIVQVPGALEIPLAIQWASDNEAIHGAIACGTVIKGETFHFELVATESSRALMDLSLKLKIPIGHAILAVYDLDQALLRAQEGHGPIANKGEEAALAVVQMLAIQKR